jgi:hypothetical protein
MSNFGFVCLKLEKMFSSETTGPIESKLCRYDVCGRHSSSLFLDSYEADFIQDFLEKIEKKLAHYIDTFLSLNNSNFGD